MSGKINNCKDKSVIWLACAGCYIQLRSITESVVALYSSLTFQAFRVAADGAIVRESEVGIASVAIIIADANDQSPVWTAIFSSLTIPEVSLMTSECLHLCVHISYGY